jgi:hypothetical protein
MPITSTNVDASGRDPPQCMVPPLADNSSWVPLCHYVRLHAILSPHLTNFPNWRRLAVKLGRADCRKPANSVGSPGAMSAAGPLSTRFVTWIRLPPRSSARTVTHETNQPFVASVKGEVEGMLSGFLLYLSLVDGRGSGAQGFTANLKTPAPVLLPLPPAPLRLVSGFGD